MYHSRFKGTHYQSGYQYGSILNKHHIKLNNCPTFKIDQERIDFAEKCVPIYQKHYPEILEEIRGIAEGNQVDLTYLRTMLLSMYCFNFENKCTVLGISDENNLLFGRNSDFLVSIEKLYTNVIYHLDHTYAFTGNTTAFVQMEDGVNEYGLAVGLTFVPPKKSRPGFNAGILTRYLLEKCQTVQEAINNIKNLPIASSQTITLVDRFGDMAIVECNYQEVEVITREKEKFLTTANKFNTDKLKQYNLPNIDDWSAQERYQTSKNALIKYSSNYSLELVKEILSGNHGFMCQYDRKKNADTVWSVIYDLKNKKIYRVEGNPGRKRYIEDNRFKFNY